MTSEMSSLKELHDQLLAEKPPGAVHEPDSCPLCAMNDTGGAPVTTYTEDELKEQVDKAVKKALKADAEAREATSADVAEAVAAVQAGYDAEIAELRSELDLKVLEVTNAQLEVAAIKAWLQSEADAAAEFQLITARKAERLAKVKEVAAFPEDYLSTNADRFAAMSDEDFQVALDGWAAISSHHSGGDTIPTQTALHAGRESTNTGSTSSATKEIFALRRDFGRVDLSTL